MQKTTIKPFIFVLIALILFGLLGLEFPVFILSRVVDGRTASQTFSWPVNWYGAVFHWTVTMLIWAAGAAGIYLWAKKKDVLPALVRFDLNQRNGLILTAGILLVIAYELVFSRLSGLTFPQVWREYRGFQTMYGRQAWIVSVFQNLYYLLEFVLVVMILAFFQRGGELWFKAAWFPWGGIGLALTWGTIHLVTNPQGAVGVIIGSVLLGIFFVLSGKNFYITWILGVLGYIL
jgi:hypothetical protein